MQGPSPPISSRQKKGPRWKNGETTEVLPTSHTKLHQLFLQEENGVSSPTRRSKLKRRLNGFPFNSKTEKSYMDFSWFRLNSYTPSANNLIFLNYLLRATINIADNFIVLLQSISSS